MTILFANVNASDFMKVGMKLVNIVTRNTIWEISLNIQNFTSVRLPTFDMMKLPSSNRQSVSLFFAFDVDIELCRNNGKICTLAKTKIGRLVHSNSLPGGTVIRILRFFEALYLLFLPSHRFRTKQNRPCQLLLNVRMQYGWFTQCQKRIKSLIFFNVNVLLAELYVKY
jgi:hypothetical protein